MTLKWYPDDNKSFFLDTHLLYLGEWHILSLQHVTRSDGSPWNSVIPAEDNIRPLKINKYELPKMAHDEAKRHVEEAVLDWIDKAGLRLKNDD